MTYRIERLMGGAWFVVGLYASNNATNAIKAYCAQNGVTVADLGETVRAVVE